MLGSKNGRFSSPVLIGVLLASLATVAWVFLFFKVAVDSNMYYAVQNLFGSQDDSLSPSVADTPDDDPNANFLEWKESFQNDLSLPNPKMDVQKLKKYNPINYSGPGRPTFAAYMSTRNSTIHDPYFYGAQQIAYRLLWDPRSRSEKYPFTVFVAPFIPQDQRDLLAAAGALVREIELVPWHATSLTNGRWRDLYSKMMVWNETDFSRVLLLDTDAFPMANIDDIFEEEHAPELTCKRELLNEDDKADPGLDGMCKYVYAGVKQAGFNIINGGVYVLKPQEAMHRRLMREMVKGDDHPDEQAFLNKVFRDEGPFPAVNMGRIWNGFVPQADEEGKLRIIHDKLWDTEHWDDRGVSWAFNYFNDTWDDMLALYESEGFETLRAGNSVPLL